ncbi:MAG TPA: hypothetical protein VIH85_07280 [Solirubrobacteraceae bacterium]
MTSSAADALGLEQPDGEQPAADEALGEPPPQAANPIPTVTRAASSGARRQRSRPLVHV